MPPSRGCCAHSHDCETAECGVAYSLYKYISFSNVMCFNEQTPGSCRNVFRPWQQRLDPQAEPLRSNDDDPELLLVVPFDGSVKLKAIQIIGGANGTSPGSLKLYTNRDDLDLSSVQSMPAVQEWELQDDQQGLIEYPVQVAKFNGVHQLSFYFPANFGSDFTEINFIGLKGEFTERKREAVQAVYESRPMAEDHKVDGIKHGANWQA